jgi:hypothetical protein
LVGHVLDLRRVRVTRQFGSAPMLFAHIFVHVSVMLLC